MRYETGDAFAFDLDRSILADHDVGVFNGRLSAGTPPGDAFAVAGLFAPPLASPDFLLDVRLHGERVETTSARWRPRGVERAGSLGGIAIETSTWLADGERAGMIAVALANRSAAALSAPLLASIRGFLDATTAWEFQRPRVDRPASCEPSPRGLVLANDAGAIEVHADLPGCRWDPVTRTGRAVIDLAPGEALRFTIAFAIGGRAACRTACAAILADAAAAADRAREAGARDEAEVFDRLPRLSAADPRLEAFYRRSLVSLPLHRWEVPEFVLHPYYGVGSVNGGVVGCYLWDFGIPGPVLTLYDPRAVRAHILRFLEAGIDDAYGFNPATGARFGTWYAVNPEKMVWLVRHHVALTGDDGLLAERAAGRSVLDHVLACAGFGDDPGRPVDLVDYREEKYHLELRRGYAYDHFVPDLNGRRHDAYLAAADLAALAGQPRPWLADRARGLKRVLRDRLWDAEARWFRFVDGRGGSDLRWTNEVFELVGSGVLDRDMEEGIVSHLNDREFLSDFGMHSISKLDPAYDAVDIDHGGGGSFSGIAPGIAGRFYRAGYAEAADDLLARMLWWGERLPYWGDSLCADRIDYRRDTPYTAALPSAAGAQAVIFGLFGVSVGVDGAVSVAPRVPSFSPRVSLHGVRIRGVAFDLEASPDGYVLRTGGRTIRAPIGERRDVVAPGRPAG